MLCCYLFRSYLIRVDGFAGNEKRTWNKRCMNSIWTRVNTCIVLLCRYNCHERGIWKTDLTATNTQRRNLCYCLLIKAYKICLTCLSYYIPWLVNRCSITTFVITIYHCGIMITLGRVPLQSWKGGMFPLVCTALRIWLQLLDKNKQQAAQENLISLTSPHLPQHSAQPGKYLPLVRICWTASQRSMSVTARFELMNLSEAILKKK